MKKKKRNRVILAICSMFIACMSIFAFIPKEKEIVKADSIVTDTNFRGSYLYFPCVVMANSSDSFLNYNSLMKLRVQFHFDNGIVDNFALSVVNCELSNNNFYSDMQDFDLPNTRSYYRFFLFNNSNYCFNIGWSYSKDSDNNPIFSIPVCVNIYTEINPNIVGYTHMLIKYLDAEGNYFLIEFYFKNSITADNSISNNAGFDFPSRTYYFQNAFDNLDNFNIGYDSGYSDGLQEGNNNGYYEGLDVGYNDGYNQGKNDGYNLGRNDALNSEQYSFDNLLSAVIDVPVRTFTSLFNFEILGVNLSGFFLGLLTCCIVITIVRLLL